MFEKKEETLSLLCHLSSQAAVLTSFPLKLLHLLTTFPC